MTQYTHWAEKIDSYEKYVEAKNKGRLNYAFDIHLSHPQGASHPEKDSWFVYREMYREACGIYPEPSTVLTSLRNSYAGLAQYFVHVSKEDPTMVAYTPDRTAGMADKQVRTTLGRFLRKYLLCPSDDWVAKQEAQHRADLNGEFLTAKTIEEIEEVYTKMSGDSGCMRYTKGDFKMQYHPSAVYTGPGLAVAYLRNGNGDITARTVIYVNPDKPDDKRFVRMYGDQALTSKLKRQGFRCAALEGAKLAMLKAGKSKPSNAYIMPYLDGPGGNRGNSKDNEAPYVVWPKGEDYFLAISQATADKLSSAGIPYCGARGTSGYVEPTPADLSSLNTVCHFTGRAINLLTGDVAVRVFLEDGKAVFACSGDHLAPYTATLQSSNGNNWTQTICTPDFYTKNQFNSGYYPDEKTVAYFGYRRLSDKFYPDLPMSQRLVPKDTTTTTVTVGDATHWVKSADVYIKLTTVGDAKLGFEHTKTRTFKDEVPALRKDGWVAVAPFGSIKAICHKDNPALLKLTTGRMALQQCHEIVPLVEGGWTTLRLATAVNIFGTDFYTMQPGYNVDPPVDVFRNYASMNARDLSIADELAAAKVRLATHVFRHAVSGCRPLIQEASGPMRVANSYSANTYDNLLRAANTVSASTDEQLRVMAGYAPACMRLFARSMVALDGVLQDRVRECKYAKAEAEAIDYSMTPEEVLAQAARDTRNHPKPAPKPVNGKLSGDELLKWARTSSSPTAYVSPASIIRMSTTA